MAIAYDSSAKSTFPSSGTSVTFSHTCSGDERFLVVSGSIYDNSNPLSATYNGVSMTLSDSYDDANYPGNAVAIFTLVNPPTGAHNVVITASVPTTYLAGASVSFTGVKQTGNPTSTSHDRGVTPSFVSHSAVAVTGAGSWIVGNLRFAGGSIIGCSLRQNFSDGYSSLVDTDGPVTGSRDIGTSSGVGPSCRVFVVLNPTVPPSEALDPLFVDF